ncbi:signal peptidase I [Conexibacter sp. CPCC 206217]|uniref:signal peptidase I n=1 Tax=Conexibacter sp. CPCC 206217 TaxID=3064574 RepID=UPI00271C9C5E|nr:signal peptidase I [Conexibacter sp. CPCC 206217]MDO8212800.1 signal peptidase I [Conexibacter sp. CPCC 206217]
MRGKSKSASSSLLELVFIVAVALGLALGIQAFIVKPYRIPSGSMEPTLAVGERVLVNRIGNNFTDPGVGDILVFHPPRGADTNECGVPGQGPFYDGPQSRVPCSRSTPTRSNQNFIKRVVGVPGDRISVRDGHVVRNGVLQKDSFINACGEGSDCNLGTITVPKDQYFMMGDNRGESDDSRYWGPIKRDWIIGGAFASYWPPKRIGPL